MGPFFPRGPGPLASVILPTRGRPGPFLQSIDSLVSLADNPGCLEFLFKVDDDDQETIDTVKRFMESFPQFKTQLLVGPRGNGYHDIWKWDNDLASRATGDWLLVWNDDAVMKTEKWDKVLTYLGTSAPYPGIHDVCMVVFPTLGRPHAQEFFCLRRKTFELLGHMFLSCHGDNWLYSINHFLGTFITASIYVDHTSDRIGDQTRADSVEAYKESIVSLIGLRAKWERFRDVSVLLTHLSKVESQLRWSNEPVGPGWHYWRRTAESPTRAVVVTPQMDAIRFNVEGDVTSPRPAKEEGGLWSPMYP